MKNEQKTKFFVKQIDKLQDKLENIALKASMKHTTNNTINFIPFTYEAIVDELGS
jgi:hypothetical protein